MNIGSGDVGDGGGGAGGDGGGSGGWIFLESLSLSII